MVLATLVCLTLTRGATMGEVRAMVPPDLRLPDMPAETDNGWTLAAAASGKPFGTKRVSDLMAEGLAALAKEGGRSQAEKADPRPASVGEILQRWNKEAAPEQIAEAEEVLRPYEARFRFLRAAVARPAWALPRPNATYRPGQDEFDNDFPGLSGFNDLARALTLRASVRMAKGEPDEAVEDIVLIRRMASRLCGGYGGVMPHLVGMGIASIANGAALRFVAHPGAQEFQLLALKKVWEEEAASNLPNAIKHDFDFGTLRTIASTPTRVQEGIPMPFGSPGFVREMKRISLMDRQATVDLSAKYLRIAIENRTRPWSRQVDGELEAPREEGQWIGAEPKEGKPLTKPQEAKILAYLRRYPNPLGRQLVEIFSPSLKTFEMAERRREAFHRMTLAALAIRIAGLREGKAPDSLAALVSAGLLPAVPVDPFGDGALRYDPVRRTLWSLGEDGKDDGGKGRNFATQPDMVVSLS